MLGSFERVFEGFRIESGGSELRVSAPPTNMEDHKGPLLEYTRFGVYSPP